MYNVVIAGASVYGLNNLSDDAMLKSFCDGLLKELDDLNIYLITRHPDKKIDKLFGVHSIQNFEYQTKEASNKYDWFRGLNPNDDTKHLKLIYDTMKNSDMLIIGGDPFIDITIGTYKGLTPYVCLLVTLAKFLNKPIMFNGFHVARPLRTEIAKEMMKYCLGNADLVTIREDFTLSILSEYGIDVGGFKVLADAGWSQEPKMDHDLFLSILSNHQINNSNDNFIGITFRHMYWKWDDDEWKKYRQILASFCDELIQRYDAQVLFIPHCTYNRDHYYEDDRNSHNEIRSVMNSKTNAHVLDLNILDDVLSIFPHLTFAIGNRRHTAIFSAISGIPGVSIGEKWHVKPLMDQLPILKDLYLGFDKINENSLSKIAHTLSKFDSTLPHETGVKVEKLKQLARENYKLAATRVIRSH